MDFWTAAPLSSASRVNRLVVSVADFVNVNTERAERSINVALAAAVARHSAHGWDNLALPHDYAMTGELLSLSPDEVAARIARVAAKAATEWEWYGVQPPPPVSGPAAGE